jgi:hypothetical protein
LAEGRRAGSKKVGAATAARTTWAMGKSWPSSSRALRAEKKNGLRSSTS